MQLSILAVDDSPTIRTLVSVALTGAGFKVRTADDGVAGLEALDEEMPDLVITDINMPRLDGFGVIEGIRKKRSNKATPILVLTTETGPELRARAREAGATGWLVKPFDPEKLISTIKRVAA